MAETIGARERGRITPDEGAVLAAETARNADFGLGGLLGRSLLSLGGSGLSLGLGGLLGLLGLALGGNQKGLAFMANIKSQKKRIITNEKRRMRNRAVKSAGYTMR